MNPASLMSGPPLPPDVVQQQTPPAAMEFMRNAGAASQQAMQQFNAMDFVKEQMQGVVASLKQVAEVLVVEKPALVKYLQVMAQAGSSIMNEIEATSSNSPQPTMPQPADTAGAVSM